MKRISTLAFPLILACLLPALATAVETTIEYQLPVEDCGGNPVGDILEMEIYISAGPIPASDVPCPAPGAQPDEPPESYSSLIAGDTSRGSVQVDLFPGPYYARARVRTADGWSNLSNQLHLVVPGRPAAPVIIRFGT